MAGDDEELFWMDNEPKPANTNDMHFALRYIVEPGFLKVMGISLLRGRFLSDADREQTQPVVVIDEMLARKYFAGSDPIGRRLNLEQEGKEATIVGIVGHVMHWGVAEDGANPLRAEVYVPFGQQRGWQLVSTEGLAEDVVVRADHPESAFTDIQGALKEMDRSQVAFDPETMDEIVAGTLAARRFLMNLLSVFAAMALLLACVGVYGVLSHLVGQRTQEIAIRMALGADSSSVLSWVMERALKLSVIGGGIGVVCAVVMSKAMAHASIFYGMRFYDPWTLAGVVALLLAVVAAAAYIPAKRATRVDPMRTLRAG